MHSFSRSVNNSLRSVWDKKLAVSVTLAERLVLAGADSGTLSAAFFEVK